MNLWDDLKCVTWMGTCNMTTSAWYEHEIWTCDVATNMTWPWTWAMAVSWDVWHQKHVEKGKQVWDSESQRPVGGTFFQLWTAAGRGFGGVPARTTEPAPCPEHSPESSQCGQTQASLFLSWWESCETINFAQFLCLGRAHGLQGHLCVKSHFFFMYLNYQRTHSDQLWCGKSWISPAF